MDQAKRSLIEQWLRKATNDLKSAARLAGGDEPLLDTAIYHCQQAAEKAIKAYLTYQDCCFGKTHDLSELLEQAMTFLPELSACLDQAELLTPCATLYRYPGDVQVPTRAEFDEALAAGQSILERMSASIDMA